MQDFPEPQFIFKRILPYSKQAISVIGLSIALSSPQIVYGGTLENKLLDDQHKSDLIVSQKPITASMESTFIEIVKGDQVSPDIQYVSQQKSNNLCTYIPRLLTDKEAIATDFLLSSSNQENVVAPKSFLMMGLADLQWGTAEQEVLDLQLFFPNASSELGNDQSNETQISLKEKLAECLREQQRSQNTSPFIESQTLPQILVEPERPRVKDNLGLTPPQPTQKPPESEVIPSQEEEKVPPEQPPAELSEEVRREVAQAIILDALNKNAERYPWLINQSDRLIISPAKYQASPSNININFDTKFSSSVRLGDEELKNPLLNDLNFSQFDEDKQFYWILNNNRIVAETRGIHGDFEFQGQSTIDKGNTVQQVLTSTESLFGVQAVWALPAVISGLFGEENPAGLSTSVIAVEISSSQSFPINSITLDTGIDFNDPSVIFLDNLDLGETFAEIGGGSLFENLSADNVPKFLQGFPTVNLQPLIGEDGDINIGQVISAENYALVRDRLDNVVFSSLPGIDRLRPNTGANEDLVRILANPFLSDAERNFHYLNSLFWVSLGERDPIVEIVEPAPGTVNQPENRFEENDWTRFTTSFSRHRALLEYDAEEPELRYSSIFANPGLSLSLSGFSDIDENQTFHGTVGMILGSLFYFTPNEISTSLEEARDKFDQIEPLGSLKTKATREQRRQMNVRLNSTLSQADGSSALHQASGSWTFKSTTTPDDSLLFQLRTGLYRRGVLFISAEQEVGEFSPLSLASITGLRIANDDFGPLTFRGERFPIETTAIDDIQRVFAVQTIIRTPDQTIVASSGFPREQVSTTTVPLIDPLRPFDLTFDLIELSRSTSRNIRTSSEIYSGYLFLPATELLLAGTKGGLNYGVSIGSWINFDPDKAPDVDENQTDELNLENFTTEPSLGLYVKATANWISQQVQTNKDKQVVAVTTHIPFLNFNWNTSANRLNEATIIGGYQFSWRNRQLGLTLTPSFVYTPQTLNAITIGTSQGQFTANLGGRFFTQQGLDTKFNLESGDNFFFDAQATYKVIKDQEFGTLAVGGYYSNYNTLNRGLTSRVSDDRLGVLFNYSLPRKDTSINLRLGTSDTGFEALLEGGIRISY